MSMNEDYVRTVVCAALEDLVHVRETHGARSPEYQGQLASSLCFIRGSLEEVLTAALRGLQRSHDSVAADAPEARR
jgi:hypothetical protein